MRLPDAAMDVWFELLAIPAAPDGAGPRDRKRWLARAIVERFHGADAARAAEEHFDALFVRHAIPEDVDSFAVPADWVQDDGTVPLPRIISAAFGRSSSDARRLLAQGGVKVAGESLPADKLDADWADLSDQVLQVGKRHFRRLVAG
jgi:tyrosyl-tRNA synthetase